MNRRRRLEETTSIRMLDQRRAVLVAALAAARVKSPEPALMARHGYDLSLTSDKDDGERRFCIGAI